METSPIPDVERIKFKKAALFWAWHHKYKIKFESNQVSPTEYICKVTLISKHRYRAYD